MSVCQTNPLNTLVSKSGYRFGPSQDLQRDLQAGQGRSNVHVSHLDRQFAGFTQESLPGAPASIGATPAAPAAVAAARPAPDAAWIDQFAKMQVRDRAAFSEEYKRMYSQYESRGVSRDQQQAPVSSMGLGMGMGMGMGMSSAVPRPLQAASGVAALSQDHIDAHLDQQLEEQFAEIEMQEQELEQELEQEQEQKLDQERNQSPILDQDQIQLKEAAHSIYTTLSSNTTPNNAKFSNSKFLGLMRNISDGVVTIKKDREQDKYTELYSPSTGETFGEEYFPIQDDVTSDPLNSIDNLSNMSSSEAAAHVFRGSV